MKKLIQQSILVASLAAFAVTLPGCGGEEPAPAEPEESDPGNEEGVEGESGEGEEGGGEGGGEGS